MVLNIVAAIDPQRAQSRQPGLGSLGSDAPLTALFCRSSGQRRRMASVQSGGSSSSSQNNTYSMAVGCNSASSLASQALIWLLVIGQGVRVDFNHDGGAQCRFKLVKPGLECARGHHQSREEAKIERSGQAAGRAVQVRHGWTPCSVASVVGIFWLRWRPAVP